MISGRSADELKPLFPRIDPSYSSFIPPSHRLESVHDLHVRCERFVAFIDAHKDYAGRGRCILFVGHAASTIAFYRALMRDHVADFYPATCSLTKLVISSEPEEVSVPPRRQRPEVMLWGDCTHLSSGQQRPWRFTPQHDQELVEARLATPPHDE